jgi:hypothetical protein
MRMGFRGVAGSEARPIDAFWHLVVATHDPGTWSLDLVRGFDHRASPFTNSSNCQRHMVWAARGNDDYVFHAN